MKIKNRNVLHDIFQWLWEVYLENDKNQYRNIEIIAPFVMPGMQLRGTSQHLCIYILIVGYLVIILESRLCCILYSILFHYISTNISNSIIIMETIDYLNMYLMM